MKCVLENLNGENKINTKYILYFSLLSDCTFVEWQTHKYELDIRSSANKNTYIYGWIVTPLCVNIFSCRIKTIDHNNLLNIWKWIALQKRAGNIEHRPELFKEASVAGFIDIWVLESSSVYYVLYTDRNNKN